VSTPALPAWAEDLRARYLAGEAVQFLLHGNVRDLVPWEGQDVPLATFLEEALLKPAKDIVLRYDISEGLAFATPAMRDKARTAGEVRQALTGEPPLVEGTREARRVLPQLEAFLTLPGQRCGLVIDYVETIVPAAEPSHMSAEDRAALVTLERWAHEPRMLHSHNIILLVAEHLGSVNPRVVRNAQVIPIEIPLPDGADRLAFLERALHRHGVAAGAPMAQLARLSSGLRRIQLEGIVRWAKGRKTQLDLAMLARKRKEIIEHECQGLVELIEPSHGLDAVGGQEAVKERLGRIARAIHEGRHREVPMGIFLVGPMGTGKTWLAEGFARDSGLTCLALKNFRDRWVGSTEANLEKILGMIRGLGSVLVLVDEVDRALGGEDGDSGVSSRVFARLKTFMSDTSQRGKVLWMVMSNRPDKLDIDLKRPGRFDEKIPFFLPWQEEERMRILQAQLGKHHLQAADDWDAAALARGTEGFSAAEIEALLLLAARLADDAGSGGQPLAMASMAEALGEFVPNRNTAMIRFMELLAVYESSSRRYLPPRYAAMSAEDVQAGLTGLKRELRL